MALRVDMRAGDVVLTWPLRRTNAEKARRFVEENRRWIEQHRKERAAPVITEGSTISVFGKSFLLVQGSPRGITRFDGDRIIVHGHPEHFSRRLQKFLKEQSIGLLTEKTAEKTARIGKRLMDVRVIDPKSRWGSCAPDGRIMFSWRLILAPPDVLDYVVAHEVAHRVHMNHSRAFWRQCLDLCEGDGKSARKWLKVNGHTLMQV